MLFWIEHDRFLFFGRILAKPDFSSYKVFMQKFDVIIIGAGIAGASLAARLAGKKRIALLDMEARAGYHTTSRSAAAYVPNYGSAPMIALTRASKSFFTNPPQGFVDAMIAAPRTCIILGPEGQEAEFEEQMTNAHDLTEISEARARELFPPLRTGYAKRILFDPHTRDLDVDLLHRGFLRMAKNAGAEIFVNAPVEALQRTPAGWQAIAGKQHLSASVIVNAAGAWGDAVAKMAGVMPVGLQPKRRSIGVVPLPAWPDLNIWPMINDAAETWYAKPQSGKLLVSSADETDVEPHDAYADDVAIAEGIDNMMQATTLEVERVEHSWGGLRTFVKDRAGVVGYDPGAQGFFWLVGQGGYGIQTSPALSDAAANLLCGEPIPSYILDTGLDPMTIAPERLR
jgi:D-arginine dehydrogenase